MLTSSIYLQIVPRLSFEKHGDVIVLRIVYHFLPHPIDYQTPAASFTFARGNSLIAFGWQIVRHTPQP
jgi:hypothetical protein